MIEEREDLRKLSKVVIDIEILQNYGNILSGCTNVRYKNVTAQLNLLL